MPLKQWLQLFSQFSPYVPLGQRTSHLPNIERRLQLKPKVKVIFKMETKCECSKVATFQTLHKVFKKYWSNTVLYLSPIQPGLQWEHLPWMGSQWWPSLQAGHTSWQFSPKKPLEQSWSQRVPFQPLSQVMQRPSVTLQGCWPLQCPHLKRPHGGKINIYCPQNDLPLISILEIRAYANLVIL